MKMKNFILMLLVFSMGSCCLAIETSPSIEEQSIRSMHSSLFSSVVWFGLCLIIYLLPCFIAIKKKHSQKSTIILIDILLGWTFVGWVYALILAFQSKDHSNANESDPQKYEKIMQLQKLKEHGAITEAEFETEKQKLLK